MRGDGFVIMGEADLKRSRRAGRSLGLRRTLRALR